MSDQFKVGVVQATPKLFDIRASFEIVDHLLSQSKQEGCDFVLFPESFIPCYPRGIRFDAIVGKRTDKSRQEWLIYWQNSLELGSKEELILKKLIKKHKIDVAIGVTERDPVGGSLYCSLLYYDKQGNLIGNHRKLKPTGLERYIWAEGDGSGLITYNYQFLTVGGLICWENYMPEARMSMYHKGVGLYLAPTADMRDSWQSTIQHIALEGRCYVLTANQFVRKSDYPEEFREELEKEPEIMSRGGSAIYNPAGEVIAGPVYEKEALLTATISKDDLARFKLDFDPVGHYSRKDVFELKVSNQPETRNWN
jgi:nitrilase